MELYFQPCAQVFGTDEIRNFYLDWIHLSSRSISIFPIESKQLLKSQYLS